MTRRRRLPLPLLATVCRRSDHDAARSNRGGILLLGDSAEPTGLDPAGRHGHQARLIFTRPRA